MWLRGLVLAVGLAGSASALGQESAPTAPRMVRISGGVMAGNILTKVQPVYPVDAKAAGVSGAVVMKAVIDVDGRVTQLVVVSGPELLRQASLDAVSQWTYRPYLLNGQPVPVETTITVKFQFSGPQGELPPAAAQRVSETPLRVSGGVLAGSLLTKVSPVFPQEAKCARVNGAVVMHVIIGRDGRVRNISAIAGPQMLRQAYMDAVSQWVYRPYVVDGKAVEVDTTVTLSISFGGGSTGCASGTAAVPVKVSGGVMAGRILTKGTPRMPTIPSERPIATGAVVLRAVIDPDGRVMQLEAISGPEWERQAVIDTVRRWTYRPWLVDGKAVYVATEVTVNMDFGA